MKPHLDAIATLAGSRRLAYAEWGDPGGRPVLFFHGTPSGRLFHHPDVEALAGLGVRWITTDRPGYGRSDHQPRRCLLDWPKDVAALADHLQLETLSVVGLSGGGPHALACAHALPDRVRRVAIVSGLGILTPEGLRRMFPERRFGVRIARWAPWLLPALISLVSDPRRTDRHFSKVFLQCPSDRPVLERPEVRAMLAANWADANRSGLRGYAAESRIFALPWGFEPSAIRTTVRLWHGDADASVPIDMARALAAAIPGASLREIPGAGHFLFFDHFREIVEWAIEGRALAASR